MTPSHRYAKTGDIITEKRLKNTGRNVKNKVYMTMNKLIEEAEKMYKQIDKAQVHLINARINNDKEGKKSAISEMETAMCNTMQLLKCFIERKDNIVDLSKVFHNVVEKPDRGKDILIDTDTFGYDVVTAKWHSDERWSSFVSLYVIKRWAYLDDLLPKGGE